MRGWLMLAQTSPFVEPATDIVAGVAEQLRYAAVRLPLAAVLGALLALRPRRRGTPTRSMPVIETQIILAIVGALIMLVIGSSLARAFGIVGAASLIRYRAKIEDPKDAVVMLSALSVGLASGVGLHALAVFGTFIVGVALWIIESFEPEARKVFELTIKIKGNAADLRPKIEGVLRRFRAKFEMRASADDLLTYEVSASQALRVDRVSDAITELAPNGSLAVEWDEKKPRKAA
jgi:hypothetical protein